MWEDVALLPNVSALPQRIWQISVFLLRSPKCVVSQSSQRFSPIYWWGHSRGDGMCQHSDAPPSRRNARVPGTKTRAEPLAWRSSANPGHSTHLSGASHPWSQSIRRRPAVILFVQINNKIAGAPHRGTQRVVIATFQARSGGLCWRLAWLHCDLVCVCLFVIFHKLSGYTGSRGPPWVRRNPGT